VVESSYEDLTCFGPYRIVRLIGSGGMGAIYEAEDCELGTRVALKLLHPHVVRSRGAPERFLREGRAASMIRHPHVVKVLALGMERETPYLAMELLQGGDLCELLTERGSLPVDEAMTILLPVIDAVGAAHDAGVIHRDLKPANIFLARIPGEARWPKVVDFGVSKVIDGDGDNTTTDTVLGTVAYMAPEQARAARQASFRSDQYSLAVLLYRCLTGVLPFGGRSPFEVVESMMTGLLVPPGQRSAGIPPALDEAVLRAMNRSPDLRFPSVQEFGDALIKALRGARVEAVGARSPAPSRSGLRALTDVGSQSIPQSMDTFAADDTELTAGADAAPAEALFEGPVEGQIATFDGVAAVVRGDALLLLWRESARLSRTQWVFDIIDRLVARSPEGIVVLMVILPTSAPPDREARHEIERRITPMRTSIRALSTVVLGDGVLQMLLRSVVRAMMVHQAGVASWASVIEATLEGGIERLREHAASRTPCADAIDRDVRTMFTTLGVEPPGQPAPRSAPAARAAVD
jgi:serine/threonine-protein kinase